MKAQEYFEKYFENLGNDDIEKIVMFSKEMIKDFSAEINALMKQRNAKSNGAVEGVIREINEKWNSVVAKVNKKFGIETLKRNVIWNFYLAEPYPHIYQRKPD